MMIRDCAKGKGIDRHFFALKAMARKNGFEMPKLFSSAAYEHFSTIVLSTSNCGNPALRMFGFGPVCPSGLGVGYIVKDNSLSFCVSSKHRQTLRYIRTLERYLLSLTEILTPAKPLERLQSFKAPAPQEEEESDYSGYFQSQSQSSKMQPTSSARDLGALRASGAATELEGVASPSPREMLASMRISR